MGSGPGAGPLEGGAIRGVYEREMEVDMRFMTLVTALSALVMWREDPAVTVPLTGVLAKCCEEPVRTGLSGADGVSSVALRKTAGGYEADLALKEGKTVSLAALTKSLEEPNRGMGADMGTTYAVGDSLSSSFVHFYKTASRPDEAKLKEAFAKLEGFKSVWVTDGGYGAAFGGKSIPTLAEVRKAGGVEVSDVLLAALKDGVRYTCRKHPEHVRLAEGECPTCKAKLEKVAAGDTPAPSAPAKAEEGPKKGCGC